MIFLDKRYGIVREWVKSFTRDGGWKPTRDQFIKRFPVCECCRGSDSLNVHHIFPVRWYPKLELEPFNLITLCRRHHLRYGHLGSWKRWNPYIWQVSQLVRQGYQSFQSIYPKLKINKEEPDYEETLRFLKKSQGKASRKGERRSYDFR